MQLNDIHIETERLVLRLPRREDFDAYAEVYGDEEATRHLGGVMSRAAAWRKFLQGPGAWVIQGFAMFAVVEKSSGEWVGSLGPWRPEGWPGNEIGWILHRKAWGRGYATEGAAAAADWAFANLGWNEIIHCIDTGNVASQNVARRLGSNILRRTNMPSPFETVVVDVWGQTREQWFARRKTATGAAVPMAPEESEAK
ncbi:MAG TPA: GNAT family N-acetyltransferase [Xanthomonadaceae bacterium]|nr:GNAT family N-acetyltransferase [Xanthomonadaceae bacterium]